MSSEKSPEKRSGGERFEDLVAVLEAGLREHLSGFEALDRDLELDPAPGIGLFSVRRALHSRSEAQSGTEEPTDAGEERAPRRADVVGVDRQGRLVLVLLVDGESDESALAALDALAFARGSLGALGQHFGPRRMSSAREPLVVLVAESFAARVIDVLALVAGSLRLFELRAVRSAGSGAAYLVPRALGAARRTPQEFAAGLPPSERALAEDVLRRAARIDERIEVVIADERVLWRSRGIPLGALEFAEGGLRGESSGGSEPLFLRREPDADRFLDLLLREHVRILSEERQPGDGRIELAKLARPSEPLLSPEEIAAFRED